MASERYSEQLGLDDSNYFVGTVSVLGQQLQRQNGAWRIRDKDSGGLHDKDSGPMEEFGPPWTT